MKRNLLTLGKAFSTVIIVGSGHQSRRGCQKMSGNVAKLKPKQEEAVIAMLLVLAPAPAGFRQRRHKVARYHLRNARSGYVPYTFG